MGGALKTGKEELVDAKDTSVWQGAVLWVWRPVSWLLGCVCMHACVCVRMCILVHSCAYVSGQGRQES